MKKHWRFLKDKCWLDDPQMSSMRAECGCVVTIQFYIIVFLNLLQLSFNVEFTVSVGFRNVLN